MRALVVTNMYPSPEHPARGRFVLDQVEALRGLGAELELEVFPFTAGAAGAAGAYSGAPGAGWSAYPGAAAALARRFRGERFDVVHAHFGLTAWPALAVRARARAVTLHGTDLSHPRSRAITLAGLRTVDLVGVVGEELGERVPRWAVRRGVPVSVLPCGVDLGRFRPVARAQARAALGLDPDGRYLLFPADPGRPEKRYDRALAAAGQVPLLTLRDVEPERVPLWVNAADAVLVTSEREGFGLAVLEALACDVPVLATPHGVAPEALAGVEGAYCGPFSATLWDERLRRVLAQVDPRVEGRAVAERYSSVAMAHRVLDAWRALLAS
jgi:glycosyltransferase involved in cell wall biosynthesis